MIPILSLGLFACEDGPNQTYSPATGTLFNSGGELAQTGDAGGLIFTDAGAYQSYSGSSKQEVCGGAELQQQWAKMVQMPIAPPRFWAGIDVAGGDKYPGLTVSQAINGPIPLPDSTEPPFIAAAPHPSRLCQDVVDGPGPNGSSVGGSIQVHWGNNSEVTMEYATSTTKDYFLTLNPGYTGGITWLYTPIGGTQAYSYHFEINSVLTRTPVDGSGNPTGASTTFNIDWAAGLHSALLEGEIDELYRGLVSNFAPDLYSATEAPCYISGTCGIFGDVQDAVGHWEFAFRPISFYVYTYNAGISAALGNTMAGTYSFNIKYAPYSLATSYLSLTACGVGTATPLCPFDQSQPYPLYGAGVSSIVPTVTGLQSAVGPIAYVTGLGDKQTNCVVKLDDTFGNLLDNCVNTSNDAATNTLTLNKIEGNLSHDDQNYTFSIVGINQNYRPAALMTPAGQFTVVSDTDVPQPADTADDFYFDTRAAGPIENDQYPVVGTDGSVSWNYDYHGSGAVMKEFARLVQTTLAAEYLVEFPAAAAAANLTAPRALHDPNCLFPAGWQTDKTFNPAGYTFPAGCTGFEGFITSGPPDSATDVFNLYNLDIVESDAGDAFLGLYGDKPGAYEGGFKPGSLNTFICNDPGTYTQCRNALIFGDALAAVVQVMGQGDPTKIPLEGRDVRFYYREYEIAKAEYMSSPESFKRGSNIGCTPTPPAPKGTAQPFSPVVCTGTAQPISSANIQANTIDTDYLILDSIGGGADRAEYVDFQNTSATVDPLDMEDQDILVATNVQSTDFFERLDREERALFVSMGIDDGEPAWGYLHDASGNLQLDDEAVPKPILNATMLITNVFGSATLAAVGFNEPVYTDATGAPILDANGNKTGIAAPTTFVNPCDPALAPGNKTAYYCATHVDADCSPHAPTDINGKIINRENGKPLLYGYCGAFQTAAGAPTVGPYVDSLGNTTTLPAGATSPTTPGNDNGQHTAFTIGTTSPMQLLSTQELQQTAIISMPVFDNPYDVSTTNNPVSVLVPWKPSEEGVGYPVMTNGQVDVFVQTASLDFSGQVVTPVVDYLPMPNTDDAGNVTSTNLQIAAVETEDFLGDVFLCYDPTTAGHFGDPSNPGDLLNVHLFTSVPSILSWLATHPNAATDSGSCGVLIRYSPFNNYVDYIQSTTYGVRLGVDQGAGGGRVSDATLFTPGTGVQASQ